MALIVLLTEHFKNKKGEFLEYFEKYYKIKNLNKINEFNFIDNKKELQKALEKIYSFGRISGIKKLNEKLKEKHLNLNLNFNKKQDKLLSNKRIEELQKLLNNATINYINNHINNFLNKNIIWKEVMFLINQKDFYPLSEKRAEFISSVEQRWAYNLSETTLWKESNLVTHVIVHDGYGCQTCADLIGVTWNIEQAIKNPLEHPNCIRSFEILLDNKEINNE